MIDVNKLNRVKGILSARLGAEIPKYQTGAKFAKQKGSTIIYSSDLNTWFSDPNLTLLYLGDTSQFQDISTQSVRTTNIPGGNPDEGKPYAALERNTELLERADDVTTQTLANELSKTGYMLPEFTVVASKNNPSKLNLSKNNPSKLNLSKNNPTELNLPKTVDTSPERLASIAKVQETASMNLERLRLEKEAKLVRVGQIAQFATGAFTSIGDAFGAALQATDSDLTKGITTGYKAILNVASNFGPVGQAASTIMGIASATGDILQALGGGTDLMTTTDKWMDSPLLSWHVGAINGFGGKKSNAFAADQDILASVGSSYGGTTKDINNAAAKANKKYGLFSSSARRRANRQIADAKAKLNIMGDISEEATDLRLAVLSMGELAGIAYQMLSSGGYDLKYTYAAKHGGSLEWTPIIANDWQPKIELNWDLPTFKDGGNIDITEELELIPELQKGGKTKLSKEVLDFYKDYDLSDVNIIMSESPRTEGNTIYINNDEDAIHELWHYLSKNSPNEVYKDFYHDLNDDKIVNMGGDLQFVKRFNGDPGYFYHPSELEARVKSAKFKTKGQDYTKEFFQNLRSDENKYGYNMRDLLHMYNDDNLVKIFNLKKGGTISSSDIPETEETNQKNVIPEGALHKNKHHMEHAEGLTKKGIPVIDEDGELQAEIEHSEIIFTLEVTKKLEEYYDIFYSDETTNKEKERAALEAGKLLVYLILENTEDRTGLIDSCKKGGSLTLKKSTDDLIEEMLNWTPTLMIIELVIEETLEKDAPKKEKPKEKSEKEQMKEAIKEVLIELLTK